METLSDWRRYAAEVGALVMQVLFCRAASPARRVGGEDGVGSAEKTTNARIGRRRHVQRILASGDKRCEGVSGRRG